MPPSKEIPTCRYDDSEFRKRVQEELWSSKESLLVRVDRLEQRVESQRFWTPILFGIATVGISGLINMLWDLFVK
jgi:hypothetical protein